MCSTNVSEFFTLWTDCKYLKFKLLSYLGLVYQVTLFVLSDCASVKNITYSTHNSLCVTLPPKISLSEMLVWNKISLCLFLQTFLLKVNFHILSPRRKYEWVLYGQREFISELECLLAHIFCISHSMLVHRQRMNERKMPSIHITSLQKTEKDQNKIKI